MPHLIGARALATSALALTVLAGCATVDDPAADHSADSHVVGGAAAAARSALSPVDSSSAVHGVGSEDFAAVRRLLHARAQAVVDGDEQAFLATIDRGRDWFVALQRIQFENLQKLSATKMWYSIGDAGLGNATGIRGGPLLSPEVVENVFISDTDQRALANEVRFTFVRRAGRWLLAADRPPLSTRNASTARPWAGPALDVVRRGHLIVVADASSPGAATRVANVVESGLTFDAGVLDVPPDDHVMVDASTAGTVSKFDNNESAGATTFRVFSATGRLAGSRIKVNPDDIDRLAANPILIRHELTHYLLRKYSGLVPTWLAEGIAQYVAYQPYGLPGLYISDAGYQRLMSGQHVLTVSGLYGQDPEVDYALAMACVTYLVNNGGVSKVKELMAAFVKHAVGPYNDQFTGRLLRQVYDLTPAQVANGAFALLADLR